jgi:Mn-dependent DtxR family transcriptional regulator
MNQPPRINDETLQEIISLLKNQTPMKSTVIAEKLHKSPIDVIKILWRKENDPIFVKEVHKRKKGLIVQPTYGLKKSVNE